MTVPKCIYLCCRNKINFITNTSVCGDNWHDGNKNSLRTIEAQIVQKLKNNEPRPKFTGSYKKACMCGQEDLLFKGKGSLVCDKHIGSLSDSES